MPDVRQSNRLPPKMDQVTNLGLLEVLAGRANVKTNICEVAALIVNRT